MPGTSQCQGRASNRKSGTSSKPPETGRKSRSTGTQAGDSHTLIVREKGVQVGTYPEIMDVKGKGSAAAKSKGGYPNNRKAEGEVYLFIRGKKEYAQRLKNAFVRDKGVVGTYQGKYIGMSSDIKYYEGDRYRGQPDMCYSIIMFQDMDICERWTQSSNLFKQKDFPSPADVLEFFAVPLQYIPGEDLPAWQLTEIQGLCVESEQFRQKYVLPVSKLLDANQIHHGVVASSNLKRIRDCSIGRHTFLLLHCAKDEKTLKDFYYSPDYAPLRQYRLDKAENDMCIFTIGSMTL